MLKATEVLVSTHMRHSHFHMPRHNISRRYGNLWISSAAADSRTISHSDIQVAYSLVSHWVVCAKRFLWVSIKQDLLASSVTSISQYNVVNAMARSERHHCSKYHEPYSSLTEIQLLFYPYPESTMPEGLHTPILDWLNWIRGHQQVEPDPEMNHRKSFASTTESSTSDGSGNSSASTASSGVFSPTLMSWHPPANTPCVTPETFQYIPLPLFRSPSSNDEKLPETSGGVRVSKFG
ncbi:hypothetical protein ColLi_10823 [Colletotrichum liriopes]|uniref:Uncharacterized protein n=1 Tax=Colletotrichum liriopes TaxID=708192 RepID=A0AA37LWJ7_9PEZI|nr:hypothetical protein ColLi_10823 [Colletotrichum liriopes]